MNDDSNFKYILNAIPSAIIVVTPIYDVEKNIVDFYIEYVNNSFQKLFEKKIISGGRYSNMHKFLPVQVQWKELASRTMKERITVHENFYYEENSTYYHITMNCVSGKSLVVTFSDISDDREKENQLTEKNQKLEAIKTELEESRQDLNRQITNIRTLNQQLEIAAYHDTMTNLYNTAWLDKSLRRTIEESENTDTKFALTIFGIDNMRMLNESSGHKAGDDRIRKVATILRKYETETSEACRYNGDEFIFVQKNVKDKIEAERTAKKLLKELNENSIGVSGGIALYPTDGKTSEDLMKFADMAKSEVKQHGKNNIVSFKQIMKEKFLKKLSLEQKIENAIRNKLFHLYFQPQFQLRSNMLRGFEALIRWHDNELGWVSPEKFIPVVEETLLIVELGEWIMDTALSTLAKWERDFSFSGIMSVNVSPVQLKQPDFLDKLKHKIEETKIDVAHLEIEITEGILIDNFESIIELLNRIRQLGIGISLDDFGTGYSSMRYLQMLPLTTLKIDKSFVSNITEQNGIAANITESVVTLVSKMGLNTIAEGVETDSQIEILKKFNCQNIQGFLKAKPMPANLCEQYLMGNSEAVLTIRDITPESQ